MDIDTSNAFGERVVRRLRGETVICIPPRPVLADYATVVREHPTWLLEQDGHRVGVLVLVPEADHSLTAEASRSSS